MFLIEEKRASISNQVFAEKLLKSLTRCHLENAIEMRENKTRRGR